MLPTVEALIASERALNIDRYLGVFAEGRTKPVSVGFASSDVAHSGSAAVTTE